MKQLFVLGLLILSFQCFSQSTWLPVIHSSPDYNNGVMLLLSDGSVMAKSSHGGIDTLGNMWDVLTPDINGSYVNGTWRRLDTMNYRRLYCSSQMLKDGRVYVAGGEYGAGAGNGETFDPLTGKWTKAGPLPSGYRIYDGNSELLPDGRVLQAIVSGGSMNNVIYDPRTNNYTAGPRCLGNHDESAWLKLPDNSILFVDIGSKYSERYIPALNTWIRDDSLPVSLYDPYGFEAGASFLLPDGRAFFIGSPGTTAYYTPSGNDSLGHWSAGPTIPDNLGAPDAAAAMMPNGKILCAFSTKAGPAEVFPDPVSFYEFDYRTNAFAKIQTPIGTDTMHIASYATGMLCLPDGNILYATIDSNKYYVYVPAGAQVAAGKPAITGVVKQDCHTYMATGTGFNGISQGAAYGDDWQMPTNYPIVRLVRHNSLYGDSIFYARTYNWNSTGVMRGAARDTTYFKLPAGLPDGNYDLEVVANGIHSDPYPYTTCNTEGIIAAAPVEHPISIYPNPVTTNTNVRFTETAAGPYSIRITDLLGREVLTETGEAVTGENIHKPNLAGMPKGLYTFLLNDGAGVRVTKFVVE
jgi:hypothetical protein